MCYRDVKLIPVRFFFPFHHLSSACHPFSSWSSPTDVLSLARSFPTPPSLHPSVPLPVSLSYGRHWYCHCEKARHAALSLVLLTPRLLTQVPDKPCQRAAGTGPVIPAGFSTHSLITWSHFCNYRTNYGQLVRVFKFMDWVQHTVLLVQYQYTVYTLSVLHFSPMILQLFQILNRFYPDCNKRNGSDC